MRDDYLWDGSGEPDPEIQKLETALGKLRHNRAAPAFPEIATTQQLHAQRRFWQIPLFPQFAMAAGILAIATIAFFTLRPKPISNSSAGWDVTRVTGAPRIGRDTLGAQNTTGNLRLRQILETATHSQANITLEHTRETLL